MHAFKKSVNRFTVVCMCLMSAALQPIFADVSSAVFNTNKGYLPESYYQERLIASHSHECLAARKVTRTLYSEGAIDLNRFTVAGAALEPFKDGYSMLFQTLFHSPLQSLTPETPGINTRTQALSWIGDIKAMMIDDQGRLRSDNGDKRIGSLQEDPIINGCFDQTTGMYRYQFVRRDISDTKQRCNALHYPETENSIGYLWRASDTLTRLSHQDAAIQRKPFQSDINRRYIQTHIGQQAYDFEVDALYPFQPEWFGTESRGEAQALINYIRGQENPSFQSRAMGAKVWRLGDMLQASPAVVGAPKSNFHLLYDDPSYEQFLQQYQHRRLRVFASSHDGLLHAFNAGWYEDRNRKIVTQRPQKLSAGMAKWPLGQEIWAFVPFDLLPLIAERARTKTAENHVKHLSLFNGEPYIFDARLFNSHTASSGLKGQDDRIFYAADGSVISRETHPGGWGTIMVVGFGTGGGYFSVEDASAVTHHFEPGYLVFDITDAEQAPRFLGVFHHDKLGSSVSLPTVVTRTSEAGELEWHLAIGSGSDTDPDGMQALTARQQARLFLLNLHTLQQGENPAVEEILLPMQHAYVGGISAADWDLDGASDALYLGTVGLKPSISTNATAWEGGLLRVSMSRHQAQRVTKIIELPAPLALRPQLALDEMSNHWLYLSSGRLTQTIDYQQPAKNRIIAIKETRLANGHFVEDDSKRARKRARKTGGLLDVSDLRVDATSGALSGRLELSPALPERHVRVLEKRLMQYTNDAEYLSGWQLFLADKEVPSSQGLVYGGFYVQPSFQPGNKPCFLQGQSFVHQLRFTTGTAWYSAMPEIAQADKTTHRNSGDLAAKLNLGESPLVNYLIHVGTSSVAKRASVRVGGMHTEVAPDALFLQSLISEEISWRAL